MDPYPRSLLQVGYDQPLSGQGPLALYAYYYHNNPEFLRTNVALRLVVAPSYLDAEIGFRQLLSPHTDMGVGLNGGGYFEDYYEVRQGDYIKGESFDGHGGGASLNLYHRINPAQLIPLNAVVQGGVHYSTYSATDNTDDQFTLPNNRVSTFARAGLRFAGKEPMLYPDLAMEVSIWFERRWRSDDGDYGYRGDPRQVQPETDLYWLYAGLSYAWTNTGNQFALALTAGGSDDADRFSAYRLGGVLPQVAEFPLTLPGYYYQELSARRFLHLSATYVAPLSADHRWQLRLGAASAYVDYLPGLEQPGRWHTGAGPSLSFTSRSEVWRVILRYGYGFNALRDGRDGAHSVGVLYQYNFERRKVRNQAARRTEDGASDLSRPWFRHGEKNIEPFKQPDTARRICAANPLTFLQGKFADRATLSAIARQAITDRSRERGLPPGSATRISDHQRHPAAAKSEALIGSHEQVQTWKTKPSC